MSASAALTTANVLSSPSDQAIRTLCLKHLHRALWLPETSDHPKLRVTYATTSNFDNASLPVILFIAPMFSSRWSALEFDKLARDCGVRLICTDRPAMGGSTPVAINIRIKVWLETVPALLRKLDVNHVSLMTHSAGAIYTLNTLLHHRNILYPSAPSVTFLAPYVPMTSSGATLPTLYAKLPVGVIDSWADLNSFINTKIMRSASWSSGLFSSAASVFAPSADTETPSTKVSTSTTAADRYGVDGETAQAINKFLTTYRFSEDTTGVNEEAKLCLRKCDDADWGEAWDYASCIRSIAENEYNLLQQEPGRVKLKVEAFFSGSDVMIGKGGQEYFEKCWQQDEVKESVNFASAVYPKANHDSLLVDYKKGALQDVFQKVSSSEGTV